MLPVTFWAEKEGKEVGERFTVGARQLSQTTTELSPTGRTTDIVLEIRRTPATEQNLLLGDTVLKRFTYRGVTYRVLSVEWTNNFYTVSGELRR